MASVPALTIHGADLDRFLNKPTSVVQIVPSPLSGRGGVNDYSGILAESLLNAHGVTTDFMSSGALRDSNWDCSTSCGVILHYVNYGYHPRGIPLWLPQRVNQLRRSLAGPLLTIFHELYASSTWRQSALWLQPLQKRVARSVARSSVLCVVSSNPVAAQLRKLVPSASIVVRPVFSTFGEPELSADQISNRDRDRWVICGGTELIRRSVRTFPTGKHLLVLGGDNQEDIRRQLKQDCYLPEIDAGMASERLATCAFGWLDYFVRSDVSTEAILKSTTFAAYCAHGVIPVFPSINSRISLNGDVMPGPFTLATLPADSDRPAIAKAIYDWYHRNASSRGMAETIAKVIKS